MYHRWLCNGSVVWIWCWWFELSCNMVICMTIARSVKTLIPVDRSEHTIWILTCYESDERSNWWCHVARMNCYASVFIVNLRIFSSNFSLAWLWFICNLVASTDNRLLLQHRRWRAPVLQLVAAMRAIMMTYHHHRRRPLRSSLPSSWGAKGQWKKLCASSRKTPLVATRINQGPSQISTVHSRSFWIRSLQSSRWLRNHCRLTSG